MSKSLVVGNGQILVNLDDRAQVRDVYFPYVGLENHVGGDLVHRVGVWTDGELAWTENYEWQIKVESEPEALAGAITAVHPRLGLKLVFTDLVYNERNIFVRRVLIYNQSDRSREIKLFFGHQFAMYQSPMAYTAYYDPEHTAIVHYRNERVFLVNAQLEGRGFDQFTTGVFGSEGKEGSHRDAEDGLLTSNPIEHGRADSVVGLGAVYKPGEMKTAHYWLALASSLKEALELNYYVLGRGAGYLISSTENYWRAWINRRQWSFHGLSEEVVSLFKKSLLIVRAHAAHNGAMIASCDFTSLQQGKDTYNYVWPRDGAFTALALAKSGDYATAKNFFSFAGSVIHEDGFFMHKYSPDGSLGSSWHPWMRDGRLALPIQEDETALVLWSLWQFYEGSKDLEFVEKLYNPLIKKAADFMVLFREEDTKLPKPSYDLWEEKWGTSTFTAASVYAGLVAAANFAKLLGKVKNEDTYRQAAAEIKSAILEHLYDQTHRGFYKLLSRESGRLRYDPTIDSSTLYGLVAFGILSADDERLRLEAARQASALNLSLPSGGTARYQDDRYFRLDSSYPGNAWFITTLWMAELQLKLAVTEPDLAPVVRHLEWVVARAQTSGLLSEQLNPYTGSQLSVSPLVWSHAAFVLTVIAYLDKLEELGICKACNPVY